jgi:hypothetical protein
MAVYGEGAPARVLRDVAAGRPFDSALAAVTGEPLPRLEARFWDAQRAWTTWVPLLASSTVLWVSVIGLGALALRRIRQRSLRIRQRWEEDEAPAGPAEPNSPPDQLGSEPGGGSRGPAA